MWYRIPEQEVAREGYDPSILDSKSSVIPISPSGNLKYKIADLRFELRTEAYEASMITVSLIRNRLVNIITSFKKFF